MKTNAIFILLDIIGLIILYKWVKYQVLAFNTYKNKSNFFVFNRFKHLLITIFFIFIPLITINFTDIESYSFFPKFGNEIKTKTVYAVIVSFLISFMWLYYIYKLDIFNKEKKYHILIVFVLASVLTSLVDYPYEFIHKLGFIYSNEPIDSFLYCVFGIGLIEETIKLIPLLLILFFSKAIDEPFDFILYASTSALGFAFIENSMYLYNYGLEIINARALYATVAHMTFSSLIGYGLFLIKFKQSKINSFLVFSFFFFLAMFSHGFYDFWLINPVVNQYSWLTTIFLLISIHVWFSIKNNTINSSNFYSEKVKLNNDKLKIFLNIGLLSIFMFSYIFVAFSDNSTKANVFFKETIIIYGFIIFYIIATLTQFNLVKGLIKPFKFTLKFLFPIMRKNN